MLVGILYQSVSLINLWDNYEKYRINWPTIPQLFVNGELIGGCDIVMEMESKGELKDVLKKTEAQVYFIFG